MYPNLTKPPLFILLIIPFLSYPVEYITLTYQMLTVVLIALSVFLFCLQSRQNFWVQVAIMGCLLTSWTFGFMIDRANADGLSMGLATLAIVAVSARMPFLGWALFALGVNIKSNILPLALPLVMSGRIATTLARACWLSLATCSVAALTPRWTLEWFQIASQRVGMVFNMDQSISIYPAWLLFNAGDVLATRFLTTTTSLICLGIIVQSLRTKRANPLFGFTLLVPCTYAYPALTYPYSMVLFPLLMMTYSFSSNHRGFLKVFFGLFSAVGALGLIANDFQMFYWRKYVSETWVNIIPSVGVSLTLLANTVLVFSSRLFSTAFFQEGETPPPGRLIRAGNVLGIVLVVLFVLIAACQIFKSLSAQP